jgi:hypothetical protein
VEKGDDVVNTVKMSAAAEDGSNTAEALSDVEMKSPPVGKGEGATAVKREEECGQLNTEEKKQQDNDESLLTVDKTKSSAGASSRSADTSVTEDQDKTETKSQGETEGSKLKGRKGEEEEEEEGEDVVVEEEEEVELDDKGNPVGECSITLLFCFLFDCSISQAH